MTQRKIHYCTAFGRGLFIITAYRLDHRSGSSNTIKKFKVLHIGKKHQKKKKAKKNPLQKKPKIKYFSFYIAFNNITFSKLVFKWQRLIKPYNGSF